MRFDDLYLAGIGSHLPAETAVDVAVDRGDYDEDEQEDSGQQGVTIAGPDESPPEMAARAARTALDRSGHQPSDISLLLYAVSTHQGLEGWNAGSYLQNEVLAGAGVSFEIGQQSNGAVASVELAAAYLGAADERQAAVVVSADRFAPPWWDRWRAGWGLVFADGASAAVLSRREGFARVAAAVTVSDAGLEAMHRGTMPFIPADKEHYPIDFRGRSLDFARHGDLAEVSRRTADGVRRAVAGAVEEAGLDLADAAHVVVPGFGRTLLRRECLDPLGVAIERTTWGWSSHVGHLGAADQFAALAHLSEAGRLAPGDRVVVIGVGGGFNWTCLVLEITGRPAWSA